MFVKKFLFADSKFTRGVSLAASASRDEGSGWEGKYGGSQSVGF